MLAFAVKIAGVLGGGLVVLAIRVSYALRLSRYPFLFTAYQFICSLLGRVVLLAATQSNQGNQNNSNKVGGAHAKIALAPSFKHIRRKTGKAWRMPRTRQDPSLLATLLLLFHGTATTTGTTHGFHPLHNCFYYFVFSNNF